MKKTLFALPFSLFCHVLLFAQPYLYGTTLQGGLHDSGILFVFNASTNQSFHLHDFSAPDGYSPLGSLLKAANGKLYGTARYGGDFNQGVLFSFDPATGTYSKEKEFTRPDGSTPSGNLVQDASGKLYGTTFWGGVNTTGNIYSYDPATKSFTNLYDFTPPDGAHPWGGLVMATNGKLYGITVGNDMLTGQGIVFSFDPATRIYTRIHTMDGTDGTGSYSHLVQASNGKLYGVTLDGGVNSRGMIFSVDPATNTFLKHYDFREADGSFLYGGLLQAANGKLYGVAQNGGAYGHGTIYSYDPETNSFLSEYFFAGPEGGHPAGGLMQASDGKLYGTTTTGGTYDLGTIFSFDPATKSVFKLKDFTGENGKEPLAGLTESSAPRSSFVRVKQFFNTAFTKEGKLVGIISEGGVNKIYRYNTDGTPDSDFGTDGHVVIDSVYERNSNDLYDFYRMQDDTIHRLVMVAVDKEGRLLVGEHLNHFRYVNGWERTGNNRIIRFTGKGLVDSSFGINGKANLNSETNFRELWFGPIAAQPDNKVVATESIPNELFFSESFSVMRLTESGTEDFYTTSASEPSLQEDNIQRFYPNALAFQNNGKIVIELAKHAYDDANNQKPDSLMLVRLNPDGTFDKSFGNGGWRVYHLHMNRNKWQNLVVQQDGKIVVATEENTLVRTNADGSIDTKFDQPFIYNFHLARLESGRDDKLYLGGSSNGNFLIDRRDRHGHPDASFNNFYYLTEDFGSADTVQNMAEVGNRLYVYGTGIYTSYPLTACTPPTFLNNRQIVLDASCGKSDGSITFVPTSGTAPFIYSIDDGMSYRDPQPNHPYTFNGLPKGTYKLRMKDATDCESALVERIIKEIYNCPPACTPPTFLNNNQVVLDASCNGGDGNISIIPLSGAAPYLYSINGGATYVPGPNGGYTFRNLSAGSYQLRLKDSRDCESAVVTRDVKADAFGPCATVTVVSARSAASHSNSVHIYPNPTKGQFQIKLTGVSGKVQVTIVDVQGRMVLQKRVNTAETSTVAVNLAGKAKGLYLVKLVSDKGAQVIKVNVQ